MNNIHVRFWAAALVALSLLFSAPAFGQALEQGYLPVEEFIDQYVSLDGTPETPENRVEVNRVIYIDAEKKIRVEGICDSERFAAVCAVHSDQESFPDYDGRELPLAIVLDETDDTYYQTSEKVFNAYYLGTPGTVAVHRIWLKKTGGHVFAAVTDRFFGLTTLELVALMPDVFQDDGPAFAVKPVLGNFLSGLLPISQACGPENQSGQTALLRVWNGRPDTGHWLTTRTDNTWLGEHQALPGWELSERDVDLTNREAGIWCVPSISNKLVQSTIFSNAPGDGEGGVWLQLQEHDLSKFQFNGTEISLPLDYEPIRYSTDPSFIDTQNNANKSLTGKFVIDANRGGVIMQTRWSGGYNEYSSENAEPQMAVLPKAGVPYNPLFDSGWTTILQDEESGLVYSIAWAETIKLNAYDPQGNQYLWQYTLPEQYQQNYFAGDTDLQFAGQYVVTYLQYITNERNDWRSVLIIIGNPSSATPEVRIIDLPGPNDNISDFSFDAKNNVGYFANAKGRSIYKLDFSNWSLSEEPVPFQPFAIMADADDGVLYATHIPRGEDMSSLSVSYEVKTSALWKRDLVDGEWAEVVRFYREPVDLFMTNIDGKRFLTVFNKGCFVLCPTIDFVDPANGSQPPAFANELFGRLEWKRGLSVSGLRQ